jgi:hypothetical protein
MPMICRVLMGRITEWTSLIRQFPPILIAEIRYKAMTLSEPSAIVPRKFLIKRAQPSVAKAGECLSFGQTEQASGVFQQSY